MRHNDYEAFDPYDRYGPLGFYGDHHKAERKKYEEEIRVNGGTCMERICVMYSRRIEPGAEWQLAHDHKAHDKQAYLGPAHPGCNEFEWKLRTAEGDELVRLQEIARDSEVREARLADGWKADDDGELVPPGGWEAYRIAEAIANHDAELKRESARREHEEYLERRRRSDKRWDIFGMVVAMTLVFPGPLIFTIVGWIVWNLIH